jgi:2-dehydro-3-deoxygalactonokinase
VLRGGEGTDDPAAFDRGLEAAGDGAALAARLFTTRSRVVTGTMPADEARSYLSGLLVGADVAATPALLAAGAGAPVHLLGDARLCRLYARALTRRGFDPETSDGETAALAGLSALYDRRFGR